MPTFYEGEPIFVLEQQITREEYARAFTLSQYGLSPVNRKEFKLAVCIALAALAASAIPFCSSYFYNIWAPVILIVFFLLLGLNLYFIVPKNIADWGCELYDGNLLVQKKDKISIYRDSLVLENEAEMILEYWTDFYACLENHEFIVVTGGRERKLFVLRKKELSPETLEKLTAHFNNTFVKRYRRYAR